MTAQHCETRHQQSCLFFHIKLAVQKVHIETSEVTDMLEIQATDKIENTEDGAIDDANTIVLVNSDQLYFTEMRVVSS